MTSNDLQIETISSSLSNLNIDLIVSGSIGAVESVRFIRSLRRLGATVTPWLTKGGSQFTTECALSWAAAGNVVEEFSGTNSHIASNDACIIAPASASMIAKIANGITDSPASALVASYLGMKKPVFLVPNMHESLSNAPAVVENLSKIKKWLTVLEPRREEGKLKFPEPTVLADQISHLLNKKNDSDGSTLITMGSTLGYIDDVRYVSNYSSGKLGSLISEELYRFGHDTNVVAGPCKYLPKCSTNLVKTDTNEKMIEAINQFMANKTDSAVMAASVLDFTPADRQIGKIRSTAKELNILMKPTEKIISLVKPRKNIKVGFKLETELTEQKIQEISEEYMTKYGLSMFVMNALGDVSATKHKAVVVTGNSKNRIMTPVSGKLELAKHIAAHIHNSKNKIEADKV